jgi:hypothetical protein
MKKILFIFFISLIISGCSTLLQCPEKISILSAKPIMQDKYRAIFEVEYLYDGSLGENAEIVITPISNVPHWSHETIKLLKGRNKVTVNVKHPNWMSNKEPVSVTKVEVAIRVSSFNKKHNVTTSEKVTSMLIDFNHVFYKM